LRSHAALRDCAWIQKHADHYSAGVPDFSVSIKERTIWFEVKIGKNNPTKLQAWTLKRLGVAGVFIRASYRGNYAWLNDNDYLEFPALVDKIVQRCLDV
jgi:hypothetical protein